MPSKLRRHDEYGHLHFLTISCYRRLRFFAHDTVKQVFIDGMIQTRETLGIRWIGYVIMPEHVHLLAFPQKAGSDELKPISKILQHVKQYVGRKGKERLRTLWTREQTLGSLPLDQWAKGTGAKPFWKPRAYDFNVTTESTLHEKLSYIHGNPVTRGLVDHPEQWPWSSYRFYECGVESPIAMDWDGSWPIA